MPTISGTSGTKAEGSALTLTGSGFGTKANAGPLVWEKFTGGAKTSALTNNASGGEMTYPSETVRPRRTHAAKADYAKDSGGDGQWCSFQYNDDTAPKWFLSWWVYLPSTWHWGTTGYGGGDDGLANIKVVRFFPSGPNYTNIDAVIHSFDNFNWRRAYEHETGADDDYINGVPWFNETFSLGSWHNLRCEYGENSGLDAADGVFKIWVDGLKILEDTTVLTNVTGDSGGWKVKRPYVIGFWDSWGYDGPESSMPAYFADIVVDETWSRVEIGNSPTYASCTHLEYQPATSWADGSITVTLNYGAFNEGNVYLYVTDGNGAKSAGFPLAVGAGNVDPPIPPDGGSTEPPPEPEPEPPPTGDDMTHSTTVSLVFADTKPQADFTISAVPLEQTVVRGDTATFQITVSAVGDFNEVVTFSVAGAGTGTSESFDPPSVRGSGTSLLRVVSTTGSGLGTFEVTITGTT